MASLLPAPSDSTLEKSRKLLRLNALASALLSLVASLFLFSKSFPFPRALGWLGLFASFFYFAYFFAFPLVCRTCFRSAGVALSQIGVLVISLTVYYTGGVASPFTFLYFAIIVYEGIYDLGNPVTVPFSIVLYLLVVGGQFFGLLPVHAGWAAEVYSSPILVTIMAVLVVTYLGLTKGMSGRIMSNLRGKIERETAEKDALVRKFSELNSTTQLGVLAHHIAHDLRGPMASISGYLELEALKDRTPEEKQELRSVSETVDAMGEILHGITRFGKPGGPSVERIQLADFMRDIVAIASLAQRAKGVRFEVEEQGDKGVETVASRADLQQAYFNVIKNAVEAVGDNPDGKHVRITVKRAEKDALVAVSDNGPGMPAAALSEIFRKSVTTKKDGTGVGLLITRDLVVRNRGEIKVRNLEGGGFTVETMLPLA